MFHVSRFVPAVVLTVTIQILPSVVHGQSQSTKPKPPANPPVSMDPDVLKDFQQRVEHYIKFQRRIEKQTGAEQKRTNDPGTINVKQDALADIIRARRLTAKQGDIFTPQIADEFRRLLNPEVKGRRGAEVKQELREDFGQEGDEGKPKPVPLKVNEKYPEGTPLPTVPTNLLQALPTLPPDVEYRIIGKTLILRDVDANLIVDFVPHAIG